MRSGDQLFSAPLLIQFLTIVISTLPSGEPIGILDPRHDKDSTMGHLVHSSVCDHNNDSVYKVAD